MLNESMNKKLSSAIEFCIFYGESAAGYNEHYEEYDVKKLLEEGWKNEYIGLKKEDLGQVLDIFEDDFGCWENCYRYKEVLDIREWIKEKRA